MTWVIERLNRDGSINSRVSVQAADDNIASISVGRALDNDVVIDDPHAAPHHARLDFLLDGSANVIDIGSKNKIINHAKKHVDAIHINALASESQRANFIIGQTLFRLRNTDWPISDERVLSRRNIWPYALGAFLAALSYSAYNIWLGDISEKPPQYLNLIAATAAGLAIWSSIYAVFGRLISGVDRLLTHLLIACIGFLSGSFTLNLLESLAFATSWLWPIRITETVVVIAAAITVAFHLKVADPRHWRSTRIAIVAIASLAIVVPIAQLWILEGRLTRVQTHVDVKHPLLRIAPPIPLDTLLNRANDLKEKVDADRKKDNSSDDGDDG
jgi:FHA domain